jgi:hypothetical protein
MMRLANLLPFMMVAACSSGPSKQDSVQVWAAASAAMSSAQEKAVTEARDNAVAPISNLTLDWAGACSLGGTIGVTGSYEGEGSDDRAAFDIHTKFTGCHEASTTLDGEIHWTSVASGSDFNATMLGDIGWHGTDGDGSCEFNLSIRVSATSVSYGGELCGYQVGSELTIGR